MTKKCNCELCKRNKKWDKILKKYPFTKSDLKFLEEIYMDLNGTELNYEVDQAIFDGSWPSARETLERGLKNVDEYEAKKNEEFYKRRMRKK